MSALGNVSENNAVIAENQQEVYEAGMRAGLAQNPEYADGYTDGYKEGLKKNMGYEWDALIDGSIPVGKAVEADHSAESDHSVESDHADKADEAKSLEGTLSVEGGGTGATTPAEALKNLGITYGTEDLVSGTSPLASGTIYFVYA